MSGLQFAQPQWVHLLWGVAAFVALLAWLERRGGDALARFVGAALQPRLLRGPSRVQRGLRIGFLGLAGLFLTLALMRPQWGLDVVTTPRVGAEIMICLDVSRSMLAEDVAPNRLDRAKADIRDLLGYLDGDQVGLIAFAGRAVVLSPLTPDFGFVRLALDGAGPDSVGRGGTRLEEPVRKAIAGFGAAGDVSRSILLITDGEDHDSYPLEAARAAAERGVGIIAIGFGDEAGSEIAITDPATGARTRLRDADGQVVKSRLDGDLLREMALATGGAYVPAGTGALDLDSIFRRHLAPLTRGRLDGRSRAVRNDAYQWAVLLGLLAVLGAVASTARPAAAPSGAGGRTAASLALPVLLGLVLWSSPWPGSARSNEPPATEAPAQAGPEPPAAAQEATAPAGPEIPEDAREAYNLGLERLDANDVARASELLAAAREHAGTDGEVRFRASYNLGWAEVRAADAAIESEPGKALEHLYQATDWFQEAVRLRPAHEQSRYNLEIVTRRALELADSLAKQNESGIDGDLDRVIAGQRAFLSELRAGLAATAGSQPGADPETRRAFRTLASRELAVLADADTLNRRVVRELDALQAASASEQAAKDRLRAARLEAVLGHLNRARERVAQARTRLRRVQGERAYRRASDGLGALNRARDQLRDPAARLDTLLAEGLEVAHETERLAASNAVRGGTVESPPRPRWLTRDYLADAQSELEARTGELHDLLRSGIGPAAPGAAPAEPPSPAPGGDAAMARLREAAPLVGEARDGFAAAAGATAADRTADALVAQRRALERLASARELLLDLRRLIELVYASEVQVRGALAAGRRSEDAPQPPGKPAPQPGSSPGALAADGIASRIAPVHGRNVERMARLGTMITDAAIEQGPDQAPQASGVPGAGGAAGGAEAERQRYERAFERWQAASEAMHVAQEKLESLASGAGGDREAVAGAASGSVDTAVGALEDLRRLFFGLREHLEDTARRQQALVDETEAVAGLDSPADPDATVRRAGPLAPRQSALGATAEAIAKALRERADAATGAPPEAGSPPAPAAGGTEHLGQAADLVARAQTSMSAAADGLAATPPDLTAARDEQDHALADLLEALALLGRPPDQPADGGGGKQPAGRQAQDRGEGKDKGKEQGPSQEPQPADFAQLLQGVRDREAQRREERSRGRGSGYEPVEKDW